MKKRFVLMGLVSVLLMATLLFAACSTGDDDGESGPSVTVPTVDDLPPIPDDDGVTAVANEADAEKLLAAFWESGAGWGLGGEIESVIEKYDNPIPTNTGWKGEWDFKDNESADGLKISSAGNFSESTNVPEDRPDEQFEEGDYMLSSYSRQFAAEVTANKTYGGVTLVAGSTIARALSGSDRWEISAVSVNEEGESVTFKYKNSMQDAYGVGMTVILDDGKAGKIIIALSGKISVSGTMEDDDDDPEPDDFSGSVSGSIKVYGASDSLVYTMPITMDNVGKLRMDFLNMYFYEE